QHRAPKPSKGDSIATSNFINVVGAIVASVLFSALVSGAELSGLAPDLSKPAAAADGRVPIPFPADSVFAKLGLRKDEIQGELIAMEYSAHGRPKRITIEVQDPTSPAETVPIDFEHVSKPAEDQE